MSEFFEHLKFIYGEELANQTLPKLEHIMDVYEKKLSFSQPELSEKDAILITYGDQIQNGSSGEHINTLHRFYNEYLNFINSIHFLPFFPYTSDDGFSVVDYKKIDPLLGDWKQVQSISKNAKLMFDAVVNHCSKSNPWFQNYLKGVPEYREHFLSISPETDTSKVTRPRALPLLHPFEAHDGKRHVWTTFSEDQVDLNANQPQVVLDIIDVLLFYVEMGASLIRLDAIAFLWKKLGTTCIHLPETHRIVQLIRSVFEKICPQVTIITETNVPHEENLSYFGNGSNEAHMVYNFTLPPLLAWSIIKGDCSVLRDWASSLELPSPKTTFFNFTASHDGIGMRPLQGILPTEEIDFLANNSISNGGKVSYKDNGDGTKSPYELNCNYMDFLTSPSKGLKEKVNRFICSQAVMLAMPGVPGIYVHSILGSQNDHKGLEKTGRARTINRQKFQDSELKKELQCEHSRRRKVYDAYRNMIETRTQFKAFHPNSPAKYPTFGRDIFAIERGEHSDRILCLFNFSSEKRHVSLGPKVTNILTREKETTTPLALEAWEVKWLSFND